MDDKRLRELIHFARSYHNAGRELEPWFAFEQVTPEEREAILAAIIPGRAHTKDEGLGVGPGVDVTWVDRIEEHDWAIWRAHEFYLSSKRSVDVVQSIASESESILRRLPDPHRSTFTGKGLVVGYVQSGKTANFTAVAARAVDAGYRLVIVLSGIHNNLRAQTQRRLDRELTGRLEEGEEGIVRPSLERDWYPLTERGDYDFRGQHGQTILGHGVPILAVIKKNCSVLKELLAWLESANPDALASCPTLIIDDEADQASVNTGQDRGEQEPEDPDDETSPSRTNELIRKIINLDDLKRVAYLAYTATPFANILIDPESEDREAGQDLYPSDFIWQLPRPNEYTGTRELFGAIEHESRDVVRFIPDEDLPSLRPPRSRERASWHPEISQTIIDAIDEYLLAGAVRMHPDTGQANKHHTMLVHTSHYTDCQERLATCIREYVTGLHGDLQYGDGLIDRLRATWEHHYRHSLDGDRDLGFEDVIPYIRELMAREIPILELNSASDHVLDFEGDPIKAICIGGNRLSRGLTLEGLTVSVFLRPTGMADTLLQMARWYGFRIGYEDLIRIYTTPEIANWFSELALVEDDLRAEIDRLRRSNLTPSEQGICLRAHSALRLTSQSKSQNAITQRSGWSGTHPQNIVLPLDAPDCLRADYTKTETFLSGLQLIGNHSGLTASSRGSDVVAYLRSLADTGETRTFDLESICNWIERQLALGRLSNWTIHVPGNARSTAPTIDLAGSELRLVTRSRLRGSNSIGVLIDPKHEATDLDRPAEDFKEGSSYNTNRMRQERPMEQGLLMIYLIDPASDSSARGRERLIPKRRTDTPPAIVSVALSLPHVPDDEAVDIIVNQAFVDA